MFHRLESPAVHWMEVIMNHCLSRFRVVLASLAIIGLTHAPLHADDAALRMGVKRAIERAQEYLVSQQLPNGSWSQQRVGINALVLLALANSGLEADHPTVESALKALRDTETPDQTYDIALMIMAYASVEGGKANAGRISALAQSLENRQRASGGWHYTKNGQGSDNSCTQYAILGLREAAHAGYTVDRSTWRKARDYWLRCQVGSRDSVTGAGWQYGARPDGSATGSMTVAGIGSLVIIDSFLKDDPEDGELECCGNADEDEIQKAIDAGVRWMGSRFSVRSNPGDGNWLLYYLYGLERAGRLSGRRFFGDHDWYREGADFLIRKQVAATGEWRGGAGFENDPMISTSFALLFLSKGLAPVLINKLKFGPRDPATGEPLGEDWNKHPNDVRNLVNYISGRDKWPALVTWQVLDFDKAAQDDGVQSLLQAPMQMMSGANDPSSIQGEQVEILRDYIAQGGFLLAVQNCESDDFEEGFHDLVKRMFPTGEFRLRKLPDTHDIYRSEFLITKNPPELWGVDVGCRTAIVYAPFDHACRWDHWIKSEPRGRPPQLKAAIGRSMQLGTNIAAYATNREVHDRLDAPNAIQVADEDSLTGRGTVRMAQLRHTGGWDTARNAARHLLDALEEKVGLRPATQIANLTASDPNVLNFPLLYMHGRQTFSFSPSEREQLKAHLENGGLLFADACCGAQAFDTAFRSMVEQMFGRPLERIPIEHELFKSEWGNDIRQVERRLPRDGELGSVLDTDVSIGEPILEGLTIDGRIAIVYSKYDISCALERQATAACAGYTTEDATRIAINVVLYSFLQKVETTSR